MNHSRAGLIVSAMPAVVMLLLFYSLAIHMHRALGGWPRSIGEHGFPPALVFHGNIAMHFFIALIWSHMFVVPVAALVCGVVRRWRRFLGVYVVSCFVAAGLMQLAPARFLYWWWD